MNKFTITHWESEKNYNTHEVRSDDGDYIESALIYKLFEYVRVLGVVSVKKENKIVSWELNNSWYSSDEINRMLKLKAFS